MSTNRKLGRRSPSDKPVLRLGRYLTGAVSAHPANVDYLGGITFGLYANDTYGDCGPTDVANSRRQVTKSLTGTQTDPSQDDVFDLYRRSGNPGFDPNDPGGPGDGGVDMKAMLAEVVKNGIGGTKAVCFAAVDVSSLDEIRAAIAIFGGLHLGVNLETAQQTQTDDGGPWDYKRSGEWGGHAVYAGKFTSQAAKGQTDISLVTWGEVMGTTDAFWREQVEEAYIVVWPEHLGSKEFLDGVDLSALAADYKAMTGRDFPAPVAPPQPTPQPPAPGPTPDPNGLLAELATVIRAAEAGVEKSWHEVMTWLNVHGL